MSDKPISFKAEMVRAIIANTKTQTRRLIEPTSGEMRSGDVVVMSLRSDGPAWRFRPRYRVGDRLYVREHWRANAALDKVKPREMVPPVGIFYEADRRPGERVIAGRFRQGMHMPKWATRLTLHIAAVRVQRLQEITLADVLAEGCPVDPHYFDITLDGSAGPMVRIGPAVWATPRAWYRELWDAINGAGSWDTNPWVAAYTFEAEHCNIAEARP